MVENDVCMQEETEQKGRNGVGNVPWAINLKHGFAVKTHPIYLTSCYFRNLLNQAFNF